MKAFLSLITLLRIKILNRKFGYRINSRERLHVQGLDCQYDRRAFNRFPIELAIEVTTEDMETGKIKDKVLIKNISGEGVKFITQKADKYSLGQELDISIYLPENDEVKARMRGKATVVRMDPESDSRVREKNIEMGIAIKIHNRLNFERLVVKIPTNHMEPISQPNSINDENKLSKLQ